MNAVAVVASIRAPEFLATLALKRAGRPDSGRWLLTERFGFYSAELGREIWAPVGFETDLASVPRWPVIYWLTGATADEAAVIHDLLYTLKKDVSRAQADAVFAEAIAVIARMKQAELEAEKVPAWRRKLAELGDDARRAAMWAGVRAGGGAYWKEPTAKVPDLVEDIYFG